MRSSCPNMASDLIARATWSWTKPVKQLLQKAAWCRGSLMTALVLHFVQFMARWYEQPKADCNYQSSAACHELIQGLQICVARQLQFPIIFFTSHPHLLQFNKACPLMTDALSELSERSRRNTDT